MYLQSLPIWDRVIAGDHLEQVLIYWMWHINIKYQCIISRDPSVSKSIWLPIFEWYVVRCVLKKGHQQDMCSKEIDLHAQNMLTISRHSSQ